VNMALLVADNDWENDSMSLFSWGSDDGYEYHDDDDHSFGTSSSSEDAAALDLLLDDVVTVTTCNHQEEALADDVEGPDLVDPPSSGGAPNARATGDRSREDRSCARR
jgi:hypothetical protein